MSEINLPNPDPDNNAVHHALDLPQNYKHVTLSPVCATNLARISNQLSHVTQSLQDAFDHDTHKYSSFAHSGFASDTGNGNDCPPYDPFTSTLNEFYHLHKQLQMEKSKKTIVNQTQRHQHRQNDN